VGSEDSKVAQPLPFPESLCHSCAAPPRYVTTDRGSVFIYCPVFNKYPPQPVTACSAFRRRRAPSDAPSD
jgi:hypothetical protein